MKSKREFIKEIIPNRANFQYCAEKGVVNGSLLADIERIMQKYANQQLAIDIVIASAEFKVDIKQAIENANHEDWIADENGEERPVYDLNEDLAAENVIKAIKKHLL